MFALLVPALVGALAAAMGSFIGRAIIALGIGAVTYTGIDLGIGVLKSQAIDGVKALPVDALNFVGFLWLDKGLTVIISAVAVALSMKMISGSIKKMVFK